MDKSKQVITESYWKEQEYFTSDNVKLIGDCLRFYADTQGHKEAVVFASSDGVGSRQAVTFKELYEKALTTGKSLISLGIKPGEFVALNIRPCPEWLFLTFGSILAGARCAFMSFTYTDGSDLLAIMNKMQTCVLLALDPGLDSCKWDIVQKMVGNVNQEDGTANSKMMPYLRYLIGHEFPKTEKIKSVQDFILSNDHHEIKLPKASEEDIVILIETTGSTDVPKLVAHTHKSLLCIRKVQDCIIFNKDHIYFNKHSFNWLGGFPFNIFNGQTRVTISGFGQPAKNHLQRAIDVISEEGCTLALAIPPMLTAMIRAQDQLPPDWPLDVIITAGQPLTKDLSKSIGTVCKTLSCGYGSTECIILTEKHVVDRHNLIEFACGHPIPGNGVEMKVVDENGQIVPVNTRGELLVKSPSMFKEYFNEPVKTSAVLDEHGWFKTDDTARMAESGEIFIDGRKSNLIISGGTNVAPERIEQVLKVCSGIEAAIIVPVPDDVYYQVLCACAIIKNGSIVTEKDLRTFCEEFHNDKPGLFTVLPKFYLFVDSFPQTTSGKTLRKELQKMAEQTFAHANN